MPNSETVITGHILDVANKQVTDGYLHIKDGKIENIIPRSDISETSPYIMSGFIDSHVHIESSMLLPSHFADAAVRHGVVGCVCDPHEIANVCGIEGINYMIEDSKTRNFHFAFAAPSCVPSTSFETSGFSINSLQIRQLLAREEVFALAEMMNFPGLLNDDKEVWAKIDAARDFGKPIDGHAPMLSGDNLKKYASSGISTDHECSNLQEAKEKIGLGMKILIREGSAAKNFETLCPLIETNPDMTMFCSDDIHPDELLNGYINRLVKRSFEKGFSIWNILQTSSLNPVIHYRLPVGLLQKGDSADLIVVDNLEDFNILSTFINGKCVFNSADNNLVCRNLEEKTEILPNNFHASRLSETDIKIKPQSSAIKVIKSRDKELLTQKIICNAKVIDGNIVSDTTNDVLKIVVYNRYIQSKPSVAFINGFGLKNGALASTIAHDSHNIIAIGTQDSLIVEAINRLIDAKGGICAVNDKKAEILCLPFGGLMSNLPVESVAEKYKSLNDFAKSMGCNLDAPFMTMAFMALLVIPELKLSDKGLFDVNSFTYISLFE